MRALLHLLALACVLGGFLALPYARTETDLTTGDARRSTETRFFWDGPPQESEAPSEIVRAVSDLRQQVFALSRDLAAVQRGDSVRAMASDSLRDAFAARTAANGTTSLGMAASESAPTYVSYDFHWPRYALHILGGLLSALVFVAGGIVATASQGRRR